MEEQFKKGFFEFIAAADAEKVHSQTIGWMFSKNCDVFDDNDKSSILNELIFNGENKKVEFIPTKVDVEINDIDILITCGDKLVVIENKIKSSQHSNQLFKYEYLTANNELTARECFLQWKFPDRYNQIKPNLNDDNFLNVFEVLKDEGLSTKDFKCDLEIQGKNPFYIYLTLIEEEPLGTKEKWNKVSYSRLHDVLTNYLKNKEHQDTENFWILKSYVSTIQNLSSAANSFINNPKDFEFVFKEGKKSEIVNHEHNAASGYIKICKMQTSLQKWFYSKLIEEVKSINQELFKSIEYSISETHGTALLDFSFKEITIYGKECVPILQFQGSAIKLALVGTSKTETKETLSKEKLIELRNDRKRNFAVRLSEIKEFFELANSSYDLDAQEKITKINSKISTPKNAEGFLSINVNESDIKYWQLENDKERFVISMIEQAQKIFQNLNDKLPL
jgi:hypothetical protein